MRNLTVPLILILAACGESGYYGEPSWSSNPSSNAVDEPDDAQDSETPQNPPVDSDTPIDTPADSDTPVDSDTPEDSDTPDETDPLPAECHDGEPVVLWASPDDSNSMASPVLARTEAESPYGPYSPIRTWEFFNYYTFDYAPAAPGELAIALDLAPGDAADTWTLQVGVVSEHVTDRAPMNLTFVLDTSGSMEGSSIQHLRDVGVAIASQLGPGDVVSMVTWNTSQNTVLNSHAVRSANDPALLNAFSRLDADGGTDLAAGLQRGYELAVANRTPGRINRVILISDGGANAGETDKDVIGAHAGAQDEDGIYLVGVGVGENYNDDLMDTITDKGKGASVYIPSRAEADAIFRDRFLETLGVAARNVHIRYTLPPGFEIVDFTGEEISADPTQVDPQHIAPNDAIVMQQTLTTCAPEEVQADTPLSVLVTWQDAITFAPREATLDTTFGAMLASPSPRLRKGLAVAGYARALEAHRTNNDGQVAIDAALARINAALADGPDAELSQMRRVLEGL